MAGIFDRFRFGAKRERDEDAPEVSPGAEDTAEETEET